MKYDFTSIIDRQGQDAMAVDGLGMYPGMSPSKPKGGFDFIPMWVADMNFPTVPTIPEAIIERAKHPAYGYFAPRDTYFDEIIKWHQKRNGVNGLKKEYIGYENGVLGGILSALQCLAAPGDAVLLHSPTYIGFTASLKNNGYKMIHSELKKDAEGIYRMDYEDMEAKIRKYHIHAAIMCSPHNPTGRVWEQWELEKAMAVYEQYAVTVISDEIIYNEALRDRVEARGSKSHYNEMNVLSMHALIGAYKQEGYEWVDELCQVLTENVRFACDYIAAHFKGVTVSKPQGTYMLFLDCTQWCEDHGQSMDELLQAGWNVGVGWQDGRPFHGEHHIRMNLALPKCRVTEAFERLDRYVFG